MLNGMIKNIFQLYNWETSLRTVSICYQFIIHAIFHVILYPKAVYSRHQNFQNWKRVLQYTVYPNVKVYDYWYKREGS